MKKLYRSFNIDDNLSWDYGGEIKEIKEDLERLEKLGATHIVISAWDDYGAPSISMKAVCERFETDEELQDRLNKETKRQEDNKRRELDELERLKLKYNS